MTIPASTGPFWILYTVGLHHSRHLLSLRPESNRVIQITNLAHRLQCLRGLFYFFLRCLKELPARVFVVLLLFLLLNALLATLPTLFDVLGAFAIFLSLLFYKCKK